MNKLIALFAVIALAVLAPVSLASANGQDKEKGSSAVTSVDFGDGTFTATSTKELSNVVWRDCEGLETKADNLSGYEFTKDVEATVVWVKSGNNKSDDGPGYGERHDNSDPQCNNGSTDGGTDGGTTGGDDTTTDGDTTDGVTDGDTTGGDTDGTTTDGTSDGSSSDGSDGSDTSGTTDGSDGTTGDTTGSDTTDGEVTDGDTTTTDGDTTSDGTVTDGGATDGTTDRPKLPHTGAGSWLLGLLAVGLVGAGIRLTRFA